MSPLARLTVAVAFVMLAGCSGNPPPAQLPTPEATVSPVVARSEVDYDTFEGRLAAVNVVDVRMRATGYLLRFDFREGTIIQEKKPLFEIDPSTYQAQLRIAEGQLKQVEARNERLSKDFDRVQRLLPGGAISREEYDKVAGDHSEAKASLESVKANVEKARLDLGYCKYQAPFTGRIDRLLVTPGNIIVADQTILTTFTSVDPVYVNFDIDERSLLEYQREKGEETTPLSDLKIACEVGLDTDDGYPHKGMLDFSASKLDASTGTYPVRGILTAKDNGGRIFTPGLRARVRVSTGKPYRAILISERAILTDQTRRYVYVIKDEQTNVDDPSTKIGTAHRVDVELGQPRGELVIVRNGLAAGDKVVVNNIQRVRPQGKVIFKEEKMPGAGK